MSIANGRRVCQHTPGRTQIAVFEFWPSDLLSIFHAAGISLKGPPPYAGDCSLDTRAATGLSPVITSPQAGLIYTVRGEYPNNHPIPLSTIVDGDLHRLYWFVGRHFLGISQPGQPLMWIPQSGSFDVRVVDDHGRAARAAFKVEWVQ